MKLQNGSDRVWNANAGRRRVVLSVVATCWAVAMFVLTLSGCRDAQEIGNVGFILGLGVDLTDSGEVQTWAQVGIPSAKPEEALAQPAWMPSATGRTFWEAMQNLCGRSARVLFRGHTRTVIIGEKLARQGIGDILDALSRDSEFRYKAWVIVTSDPVDKVLQIQSSQEKIASSYINDIMVNLTRNARAPQSRFFELIASLGQPGCEMILARLSVVPTAPAKTAEGEGEPGPGKSESDEGKPQEGKPEETDVDVAGAAVFRGDRMVGWLTPDQTATALLIRNRLNEYSFLHELPEGESVGVHILDSRAEYLDLKSVAKGDLTGRRVPLRITGEVDLQEILSEEALLSSKDIRELDRDISEAIRRRAVELIYIAQHEMDSDILGIGEMVRRRMPFAQWNESAAPRWREIFKTLEIVPEVRFEVRRRGMTMQPIEAHY